MKIFQEMAEEWWFEKKYDMACERLGFPALRVKIISNKTKIGKERGTYGWKVNMEA